MQSQVRYAALLTIVVGLGLLVAGCGGGGDGFDSSAESVGGVDSPGIGETGTIVGRVTSLRDASGVAGVRVAIDDVVAVTDAEGEFLAQNVSPGLHWLTVTGNGYAIVGGPVQVTVETGTCDVGHVVVDTVAGLPPAEPTL